MRLDPTASAAGVRLNAHEVLGSTNAEALRLASQGERGPLWVTAARQTAGRGRRGRRWVSEPGNLYASLLLTDPAPAELWPQLSFVAALAIHDAVVRIAARLERRLAIKWPNDLLLDGAKFAGILIEGSNPGGAGAVAVGIGVNCASHPDATEHPATDLGEASVVPAELFATLSARILVRLGQWEAGRGFASVRADWLARAAGLGEIVRVQLADRELSGRFEALDEAGGLRLRLPDGGVTTIAAGDVFLPAAAPETTR
jgi:BirA family biotin operon repressor/biotin-[acetyl-CoA-carboxylase] ligase